MRSLIVPVLEDAVGRSLALASAMVGGIAPDQFAGQVLHADAVTQDGSAAEGTGGVDGHHGHPLVRPPEFTNEGVGQGALPRSRRAGDAHHARAAGGVAYAPEQFLAGIGAGFHQRYRPGDGSLVARE